MPQRSKSTSRRQLLGNEKNVCNIFDFETSDDSQQNPTLSALKDMSSTLNNLVNRVENTEKDIKIVKKRLGSSSPSSSSHSSKTQMVIPNVIRVVALVYNCICTYLYIKSQLKHTLANTIETCTKFFSMKRRFHQHIVCLLNIAA